ncbi:hypothetical protein ALC53_11465 [Atta colombica]|uniref:Uncharacterized protein n=1 Tax=Atta colombica TaxID=520822 RepID=A0A195B0J2_9HYME|nr:hypothetical protein ALC53_11465 [Atta colombica]
MRFGNPEVEARIEKRKREGGGKEEGLTPAAASSSRRGWDKGEKEKERDWEKEESTMSTHAWQKIDASCALTPRGSFRVTWYRPVERSNGRTVGRATRILVNVLSGGS